MTPASRPSVGTSLMSCGCLLMLVPVVIVVGVVLLAAILAVVNP